MGVGVGYVSYPTTAMFTGSTTPPHTQTPIPAGIFGSNSSASSVSGVQCEHRLKTTARGPVDSPVENDSA